MFSYEEIKDEIYPIFMHEDSIEYGKYLHDRWADAVVLFCIGDKHVHIITEEDLEKWGISFDEIREVSEQNLTANEVVMIATLQEASMNMLLGMGDPFRPFINVVEEGIPAKDFYVLTNESKVNGANVVLHDWVLEKMAKVFGGDFYIIPSSVHEVIVLPCSLGDGEAFEEMVRDVNASHVSQVDKMSDALFVYDSAKGHVYPYRSKVTEAPSGNVEELF